MDSPAVIVRLCYPDTKEAAAEWRWRSRFFAEHSLPRLLAQTAPLDVWVWTNPAHDAEVSAMSPRIRTFHVETTLSALHTVIPWTAVRGLPRYAVQFRVDSDDLVGPRFAQRVLEELDALPGPRSVVWAQPYKLDIRTGKVYSCEPRTRDGDVIGYGPRLTSAFLALRQPVDHPAYSWVYARGHTKAWRLADDVGSVPAGHCWASCHDLNYLTATAGEQYLGEWTGEALT